MKGLSALPSSSGSTGTVSPLFSETPPCLPSVPNSQIYTTPGFLIFFLSLSERVCSLIHHISDSLKPCSLGCTQAERIWDHGVGIHLGIFRLVSWEESLCACPSAPSNIYQSVQTKYAPELQGLSGELGTECGKVEAERDLG